MIENRFCIYSKSTDSNVYDKVDDQYYSWETVVDLLNHVIPNDADILELLDIHIENNKTLEEKQLDFIVNLLFTIRCHADVHYEEMLARELAEAESVGFNVEDSKTWDYDKSDYEFWRKHMDELKKEGRSLEND